MLIPARAERVRPPKGPVADSDAAMPSPVLVLLFAAAAPSAQGPKPFGPSTAPPDAGVSPPARPADAAFERLVDEYIAGSFRARPTEATAAGYHAHDAELERFDAASRAADRARVRALLDRLAWIAPADLRRAYRLDRLVLEANLRCEIVVADEEEPHARRPGMYVDIAGTAVDLLLKRDFAPPCERVKLAASRMRLLPRLVAEARANLGRPPRLYTELAIVDAKGAAEFYQRVVPAALRACPDSRARAAAEKAAPAAAAALKGFEAWMRTDLLKRSDGGFALGADRFQRRLACAELIEEPLPELEARGRAELDRLTQEIGEVAWSIDPTALPRDVLATIAERHPKAGELLASTRGIVDRVRRFVIDRRIVPIPEGENLIVEETPLFARQLYFAAMSTPGPFEQKATEAYFYVTPVNRTDPPDKQEQHLRAFDEFSQENTVIHEAYPGHYVQGLYHRRAPTPLRRVTGSGALVEGWALSMERLMLDLGLNPDLRDRLVMLQWALIRAVRYVAAIELHAKGGDVAAAQRLFVERAFMAPANAEREARRVASEPTVLLYTYGQLAIDGLREAARRSQGPAFDLGEFHRRLLAEGPLPVSLLAEALAAPASEAR